MLKDQNNPKVLSAITEVVNKSIAEQRGDDVKVCALLSGRYTSFRPVTESSQDLNEALSHKQKKIAKVAGHPGKIDAADFAALRAGHKIKEDEDIIIDDELESLLEYEVVKVGGRRVNDEGESYDGKKVFGQRYSGGGSTPHAVHVNGKKWKTFSSQQHAQNVANKLTQQGKKATVHKEDVQLEDGEKLVEARFMKGQDVGKPGMNFSMIARKAAKKYGSKAAGQRVAGSILKKVLNKEEAVAEAKFKDLSQNMTRDVGGPGAGAAAKAASYKYTPSGADFPTTQNAKFGSSARTTSSGADIPTTQNTKLGTTSSKYMPSGSDILGKKSSSTFNKEEVIVENPLAIGAAIGAVASRMGPALARGLSAAKNAVSSPKAPPIVRDAEKVGTIAKSAKPVAEPGIITPAFTGTARDAAGRFRTSTPAPAAQGSNVAGKVAATTGAAAVAASPVLGIKAAADKSVPKPIEGDKASEMGAANKALTTDTTSKPPKAAPKTANKPLSDFDKAFAAARSKGDETFKYTPKDGKETTYTTRYKEEDDSSHRAAIAKIKQKGNTSEEYSLGESKHEMDDSKDADEHIHVQLKKAVDSAKHVVPGKEGVNTKGGADVKFSDGKHFVHADHAKKVITALEKLRPADRAKMHAHIQQSHANFQAVHKLVS